MKKLKVVLEVLFPDESRIVDDDVVVSAVKNYLDSTSGFRYESVKAVEAKEWNDWHEPKRVKSEEELTLEKVIHDLLATTVGSKDVHRTIKILCPRCKKTYLSCFVNEDNFTYFCGTHNCGYHNTHFHRELIDDKSIRNEELKQEFLKEKEKFVKLISDPSKKERKNGGDS